MRASGKLAAQVLEFARTLVKPGVKTDEIDEAVHQMIIDNGGYPSPLGYGGFLRVSVHPSTNAFAMGYLIPDCLRMATSSTLMSQCTLMIIMEILLQHSFVGRLMIKRKNWFRWPKNAWTKQLRYVDQGWSTRRLAKQYNKYGFGGVRQFVGHGVGRVFHADPVVQHFRNNDGGQMILDQTFTIEPMLTIGSCKPIIWDTLAVPFAAILRAKEMNYKQKEEFTSKSDIVYEKEMR